MVWANYEFAWGGSYQNYYKEQSLNNIPIDKDRLQPLKFQGQFFDTETGLHYNRFRYYDSDVGMFISRDPIGLLGGSNVFQYAPNPIGWIDPLGLIGEHKFGIFKDSKNKGAEIGNDIQRHHLNQSKAFTSFDASKGKVIGLKGQAKIEGTPHNLVHFHLDNFFDKYRDTNKLPSIAKYNIELYKALRSAGVSRLNSLKGVVFAIQEQLSYGKMPWHKVDRVPNRTTKCK